jgi:4-diphosphocytidyl-2-C-methyl-D-erythritol kinase
LPTRDASPLLVRSFAKINLALAVLGRRPDGYHEIRNVFQSIDLHDEIEFRHSDGLRLECEGLSGVPVESNLVWKAALGLDRLVSPGQGAHILLRKNIPQGAGLGGGSSNAASTLLGLSRFWRVRPAQADLTALSASLGSDVPFFLHGGTAIGVGRGEEIYPLPDIPGTHLLVIYPGIHVSTAEAYQSLNLALTSRDAAPRIQGFCSRLPEGSECLTRIFNDFETSILPAFPAVSEAKTFLERHGATASLLSGSGSSVFGFFLNEESTLAASRAICRESWRAFPAKTLSRAEYLQRLWG